MSYHFREWPRLGERLRGKSGDELLRELKEQLGDDFADYIPSSFDSTRPPTSNGTGSTSGRTRPDIFERHSSFPRGFPFRDDEGFGRRADIRSHLDDLAARHPEFADHLLGPPWADVSFPGGGTGSLHRSRNRHNSGDRHHNHPDEDTRSQASGSSAASGASGVSSHGSEPEEEISSHKTSGIPQYGLRNTVDIGQHQKNMEAPQQQQQQRNVRSMSAPPENRNNQEGGNGPQRYVSRVEITPQATQQPTNQNKEQPQPAREKSPAPQSKPQTQSSGGNVRHIPIFVEGRDEPVLPKADVDEADFARKQQSPPHFQRPSAFGPAPHGFTKPSTWSSHFQDPFFEPPSSRWGHQPSHPQYRHTTTQEKPRTQQTHPENQQQRQRSYSQSQPQQKKQEPQKKNQEPQQETQQAPPKPKQQIQPKDPLERVAVVQNEVNSLAEQVKAYTGNSRQDKQYMYLDEMLTRELIKLDDIETEGKENVRQARKQAIKSIQETIGLLESKAPLPGQQQQQEEEKPQEKMEEKMEEKSQEEKAEEKEPEANAQTVEKTPETMDTTEKTTEEHKAIPLPPPASPIKVTEEGQKSEEAQKEAQQQQDAAGEAVSQEVAQGVTQPQSEASVADKQESHDTQKPEETQQQQRAVEQMDSSNAVVEAVPENMETKQSSPAMELQPNVEEQKEQAAEQPKSNEEETAMTTEKPKKEPPPVPQKPSKSPKKAKKAAKKPEPVSETAIPLPAPGQTI